MDTARGLNNDELKSQYAHLGLPLSLASHGKGNHVLVPTFGRATAVSLRYLKSWERTSCKKIFRSCSVGAVSTSCERFVPPYSNLYSYCTGYVSSGPPSYSNYKVQLHRSGSTVASCTESLKRAFQPQRRQFGGNKNPAAFRRARKLSPFWVARNKNQNRKER